MNQEQYDVIVIGSGAGGGTVAQELAASGKKILILERGDHLPVEADNWDPKTVFIDRKYRTTEQWVDKDGELFTPNTHYWVGGNTSFYGAVLMRFRESDFEEVQHADGISPAWPISYNDLAPWYARAEAHWQVRGQSGVDPTAPPRKVDYQHDAVTHEPEIARLEKHLKEHCGWNPFPLPLGIRRDNSDPQGSTQNLGTHVCVKCKFCGGYPCKVQAKSDARTLCIAPIKDLPNVTLLTGRHVDQLISSNCGNHVDEVLCTGPDGEERFRGEMIVLAAGAVNSAALLLRSTCEQHPNGLANGSDQVGRNYMFHNMSAIISLTPHEVSADFPKTLGVNDFYNGDPDGSYEYPMGHVQTLEYMTGDVIEGQVSEMIPHWLIPDWLSENIGKRMLSFLVLSEDLPSADNRVRWDGERVHLAYTFSNLEGHERLVKKFDGALDVFCEKSRWFSDHHFQFTQLLPIYGTAHQCGTARMGNDPETSVVNADCRAHEVDNLYIADTSVFVSSAAVNPTLTLVANAMRVASIIDARLEGRLAKPTTYQEQIAETPPKPYEKKPGWFTRLLILLGLRQA